MDTELIPGLPEDIAQECLLRLHYSSLSTARSVCQRWRSLIEHPNFHAQRKLQGHAKSLVCLVQALPKALNEEPRSKPTSYGITLFDWKNPAAWQRVALGVPLFCQLAAAGGKLVAMGGWDKETFRPLKAVWVLDFCTGRWRRGKEMPAGRSLFAMAGSDDGFVFVAGGHDEEKNARRTAWAYSVGDDEWKEMAEMAEERDECEAVVVGGEVWVVGGYVSEEQGAFRGAAQVYSRERKEWRVVEGVWEEGKSCRGSVVVGERGELRRWAEGWWVVGVGQGRAVSVGEEGVRVRDGGSVVRGLERLPAEFSAFVQSGCCVHV
ncbi:F-box/kelch-repeat protein At2g44130-like [Wolffia australiana]